MLIDAERQDKVEKREMVRVYRFSTAFPAKSRMEFAEEGEVGRGTAALEGVAEALITHWESAVEGKRKARRLSLERVNCPSSNER